MKALTIKNPWAHLIAWGIKDIENRTWKTSFRGRVLIHSSATIAVGHPVKMFSLVQFRSIAAHPAYFEIIKNQLFDNSSILGSVEIVDCVQNHESVWAEKGCWNWVLADPKIGSEWDDFKVKGSQSFWEMSSERIYNQ